MAQQPNELDYRPARADRADARRHVAGAVAFAIAVLAWGWVALVLDPLGLRLLRQPDPGDEFLAIPISLAAVVLGVVATRDGRPALDSRLGNFALMLAASFWLTLLARLAGRR